MLIVRNTPVNKHCQVTTHEITNKNVTLKMVIQDTGIGIAPDKQEKIFSAFGQANTSTTRQFGGTGLGLTISKNLIELMQGHIWVDSELDQGSPFTCIVPFECAKEYASLEAQPPIDRQRQSTEILNILLAEDNPVNQKLATRILEKLGHQVTAVSNSSFALQAFKTHTFDLILMDMQMPEMDGLEATQFIRDHEHIHGGHTPIIALTADAQKGTREKCLAIGMDDYGKQTHPSSQLTRSHLSVYAHSSIKKNPAT